MSNILIATTESEIAQCYPVMAQLRPHLSQDEFLDQVLTQMKDGYRLAYIQDQGSVVTVAGYRVDTNLALGQFLYIDDMVTDQTHRSKGFGRKMLAWLVEEARKNGCSYLDLDSGVQRTDAHRFYEREGMGRSSYHYRIRTDQHSKT